MAITGKQQQRLLLSWGRVDILRKWHRNINRETKDHGLNIAFIWGETYEGSEFWRDVHCALINEMVEVLPKERHQRWR